ncbi:haloacid dehalogenase type II [Polycladidibacter hongkongensis]|uniref:haloacid dehalogenase type II n=1 Tax=Polycladidibacter hongkongensis TaxID=1647556 RepID=UPI00083329CD|nr:haloacid dehalogenase type II [Pseudovibrio hongkongensis]
MAHAVYAFDAYGTLFDVHAAVRRHAATLGPRADAFSMVWRQKQLEYSWVLSLMGQYADFWQLTQQSLDTAFALFPDVDRNIRQQLLDAYWTLDCYPEVPMVLKKLREENKRLVILSNGSREMLGAAVRASGLEDVFDEVFSVEDVCCYKPDPQVYDLVTTHFRVYPDAVSFQSSNRWDIAGASKFGFRAVWVNRDQLPEEYPQNTPQATVKELESLLQL